MKEIIKNIIKNTATGLAGAVKVLISVSLMICMFYGSYNYLSDKFDNSDVYDGSYFKALPEDSMDIIVLGSSHSQYSFAPYYMYQDTGLYSYVLGSACQTFQVSYEMLKEALKTQSPELVVIESFAATPSIETCGGDSCYILAAYQMTGQERYNTFNFLEEEKAKTYYNTFINNHNNWKTEEEISNLFTKDENTIDDLFGHVSSTYTKSGNNWYAKTYNNNPEVELLTEDVEALENIYQLCQKEGIEMLFYMVPHENVTEEDQAYRQKLWEWADEHGIKHEDYIEKQEEIDYHLQLHSDGFHSYENGASLITGKLADFIRENYQFKKHKYSEEIEKTLIESEKTYIIDCLETEHNPYIYLRRLQNYDGEILIRYVAGQMYISDEMESLLRQVGTNNNFDRNKNYYAVIKDGKIVEESSDYIYCSDDDNNYIEIGRDIIYLNSGSLDGYYPLTIAVLGEWSYENSVKQIQRVNPNWRYNYYEYWDVGYDRFY